MAFRTNLVPAIEERTVSGSSVFFNSAFALPLKACKVSFSATESGSGTKSPSNPYTINGASGLNLSANSVPVSVNFGDTYYGGELNVLNGNIIKKKVAIDLGSLTYTKSTGFTTKDCFYTSLDNLPNYPKFSSSAIPDASCEIFNPTYQTASSWELNSFVFTSGGGVLPLRSLGIIVPLGVYADETAFKNAVNGYKLEYEILDYIETNIGSTPIETILGNNTFSTDTGILEITFADLQEKTASGSVASFNTALAMPLSSCNIAVNAWQEGSGDPNPIDNIRPIHGFSEVNATRCGINLWDEEWEEGLLMPNGSVRKDVYIKRRTTSFIPVVPNTTYRQVSPSSAYAGRYACYGANKEFISFFGSGISERTKTLTTPKDCYYIRISFGEGYGTIYNNDISINYPSTDTTYHAYTGNTYTIQLGQEVYGAEVDIVNERLIINKSLVEYDGSDDENWYLNGTYGVYMILPTNYRVRDILVNKYKFVTNKTSGSSLSNNECCFNSDNTSLLIKDNDALSVSAFKTALSNLPMQVVFSMVTPIEISLSDIPTLSTIIGNNTIFADTGDVGLTYKDLDIAKRGNFREVFKLPS